MWRLWHSLFGWHYILLRSTSDHRYVCRLRHDASERMYIDFCGCPWFLLPDGKTDNGYMWTPLTWSVVPESAASVEGER